MENEIENLEEIHQVTSDIKLKYLGYGEWIEEPDLIKFKYKGYECRITRCIKKEPFAKEESYFGGHLCGYVKIPKGSFYSNVVHYDEVKVECHGGLTYGEQEEDGLWVGFDCAHLYDLVPSKTLFSKLMNLATIKLEFPKEFSNIDLVNPKYRNIEYVKSEILGIVDQLMEAEKKVTNES
jgi:hypothetical protein